jgi:hypothetical protein
MCYAVERLNDCGLQSVWKDEVVAHFRARSLNSLRGTEENQKISVKVVCVQMGFMNMYLSSSRTGYKHYPLK